MFFLSKKDWKINSSFDGPEATKVGASKTGINFMISILLFVENCLWYDTIHGFSVWPRIGSNTADIYLVLEPYWKVFER